MDKQFMIMQSLTSALEFIINQALVMNVHGNKALDKLDEKSLCVTLTELDNPLIFQVAQGKIIVLALEQESNDSPSKNLQADCTIFTSIATLVKLKNEQQLTQLIKQDKLDIVGDIKIAQQFAAIAEQLEIDWQSELDKHIGDIASYKVGQAIKQLAGKLKFAKQQITADASEWLVHEKRLVVTTSQLNSFYEHVSDVNQQVNGLSSRLEQLQARLLALHSAKGSA